jgi:NADH-quinone oxidoreductase subunit J
MTGQIIIFYLLALLTLGSGLLAVTSRQLFRAAIYLLFCLIGIAGIYFWLQYEFIAAVQIVVYAGGIVVLIIFSVFLTQQAGEKLPAAKRGNLIWGIITASCAMALIVVQLFKYKFVPTTQNAITPDIKAIGNQMLDTQRGGYALPFEVISILLLAALVGCIVIAVKERKTETDNTKTN